LAEAELLADDRELLLTDALRSGVGSLLTAVGFLNPDLYASDELEEWELDLSSSFLAPTACWTDCCCSSPFPLDVISEESSK